MLDPTVLEDLTSGDQDGGPPVGSHTPGRTMGAPDPTTVGAPAPGEMVSLGNSVAPAEGSHEAPDNVGAIGPRSQTGAASDPGTDIYASLGEVRISTGPPAALPLLWSVFTMRQSTGPGEDYITPNVFVAGMGNRAFLGAAGSPRRAGKGPASQDAKDLYAPDPGTPLGQRGRPQVVPFSSAPFRGRRVTPTLARRVLGRRKPPPERRPGPSDSPRFPRRLPVRRPRRAA